MTAHTSKGCALGGLDCYSTLGCPQRGGGSKSYGTGFNNHGGGFFAMEWTSDSIEIWFFQRGDEPKDLTSDTPNTSEWGRPQGEFDPDAGGGGCKIDNHFRNLQIVFDTTFCGKSGMKLLY